MTRLPDFILIGAMKSATSTLHEQLARQPGVFMSTPKEPNFFSNDDVFDRGIDWYASLFADAEPGDLCGESSTHYTKLPTHPRTVERVCKAIPRARFVYVMRHPIDRLRSQYVHEWTQRRISGSIDMAVRRHPELVDYSRYAMQLEPWLEAFGPERVLPVFQARIRVHPQVELERICSWLGVRSPVAWDDSLDRQNLSSRRMRSSPLRDAIAYAPGVSWIRRTLVPQGVRERIKALWQMRRGPEMSQDIRAELEDLFDADLARLGEWLDVPLSCARFDELTRERPLQWVRAPVQEAAA